MRIKTMRNIGMFSIVGITLCGMIITWMLL